MAYLEIKGVNKTYNGRKVLSGIDLAIEKGDFLSLLGQSGCGKTTLLRIIAGLEHADSGSIVLDGNDITGLSAQDRNIGMVFQNYALFPHMNVYENIAYGLKIKKTDTASIRRKVDEVLEKVNLLPAIKQNVSLLSGGEQQRVALARAIVTEPHIILLDEPLSNLDFSLRLKARNELKRLQNDIGITSVYVTHDQSEALSLSDIIAVMDKGNIMQTGTPRSVYFEPNSVFTADFVGHCNFFNKESALEIFMITMPENSTAAVLPEHLGIQKTIGAPYFLITDILFTGALTEYILSGEDRVLKSLALTGPAPLFAKGDAVELSALPANIKIIPL